MTIAFWTLLIAIMLPWLMALIKKTPASLHGKYNNRAPRASEQNLEGVSQRVLWAEQNSYEILPGYIAAIFVSFLVGAEQYCIDIFALIFIASRILYCLCYIKNWPSLRSAVWVVSLLCIIAIFVTSAL
ncbi:MAG: MAPEG family protein [Porticoccaceae bacterium]|nr:MAPEG family protein [Porticoccaceae bacterium]